MDYHDPHRKNGTITTKVMCAVCFLAFSFLWLYEFQSDVLAVAQHALSNGVTHYDRTIGAVLITFVLQLLQLGVYAIFRMNHRAHALTYVPSMLILAFISDINVDIDRHYSFGAWPYVTPMVLIAWGAALWASRQMLPFENDEKASTGLFSRRVWINMLQMAVMMLVVAAVGNTNAVFHFRAHAEVATMQGDFEEVLRVGQRSHETDVTLTMLRANALARRGELGERLFEYPIAGTSINLLPIHSPLQILSPDSIWRTFGARISFCLPAQKFFYYVEHDSLATPAVADYVLCAYLIDRDLEGFVNALPRYYDGIERDALPRYYREALDLYEQPHEQPQTTISDFEHSQGTYHHYYYYSKLEGKTK